MPSKLRNNFFIYYLDQGFFGEIAVSRNRKGIARSVNQEGKVISLIGDKVYPPEVQLYSKVKRNKKEDLETVYQRAIRGINKSENALYEKLLQFKGKGKLFIRCEMVQSTNIKDVWIFTEVIHVVKGDLI